MFEHSVQDSEQLAHTGGEGCFLGFTGGTQAMVESTDDRIMAGSYQGSHVESRPYHGSPAPNRALASQVATVPVKRGDAYQSSDLPAVQIAQLREIGQKGGREDGAYPGYALQQIVLLPPDGAFPNTGGQVIVNIGQLLFQPGDMGQDAFPYSFAAGCAQAVSLRRKHL